MMIIEHSTAETRSARIDLLDLSDELLRAVEMVECVVLAARGIDDRRTMNAISRVGYDAVDALEAIKTRLVDAAKGGAA